MIMYFYNELTITMKNKMTAETAIHAAKEALITTSIKEYCNGEFAKFADSLFVKENAIYCGDEAAVYDDSYELVLPEILKAIAAQGNEFSGKSYWYSDYDTEWWEFSFDGKELMITSTRHNVDDEPECSHCEDSVYFWENEEGYHVYPECGHRISHDEYIAACEITKIEKITF